MSVATRPALWQGPLHQLETAVTQLERIESDTPTDPPESIKRTHTGLSWSGVVAATCLFEAIINTIVMDIHAGSPATARYDFDVDSLERRLRNEHGSISGDTGFTYCQTLEKYNLLLEYIDSDPFPTDRDPYQRANSIVTFRNYLIHPTAQFRPTTATHADVPKQQRRIEGALKGQAQENPYGDGIPFRFYGHDYIEWIASSTIQFIDDFYDRVAAEPVYESIITAMRLGDLRG